MSKDKLLAELKAILQKAQIEPNSKYLSAQEIQTLYGIPAKTVLNRSNLPASHQRHIPCLRLKGGRKKYFERKVIERLLVSGRTEQ
jgi:hypothetical protein